MNYLLPEPLRNALLEWCEEREELSYEYEESKLAKELAAQLRDLKPLREVSKEAA